MRETAQADSGHMVHLNSLIAFQSSHAIGSWALARVIASEYPNKLTQFGVYAFATAISVSRVTATKHFPSDALVGSVFGYLIGGYVVRHHAAENVDSGFSFIPVVDVSTHTYGGQHPATSRSVRLGEGWSVREPDAS